MKRSDRRILTSHVGSLPRPEALIEINRAKFAGEAYDQKTYAARLSTAVKEICRKQAEIGVDIINDGEFGQDHAWSHRLRSMVELRLGTPQRLAARRAGPPPGARRQAGPGHV